MVISAVADMARGVGQWQTSLKLALQDIELRYRRSFLGPFWISVALLTTVLALSYVFAGVLQTGYRGYAAYLGAGLLTWQLIGGFVSEGCASVNEHSAMLKNVRMPLTTIAGRIVFRNAIIFAHNLTAIVGLMLILGNSFSPIALMALPGVAVIFCFGYFIGLALGPLCARFRDIPLAVASVMQVIFFMTPIIWMPSAMSHRPMFIHGNPFYHLLELVRAPLLGEAATALNWQVSAWFCAFAAVCAVISVATTHKRLSLWL